MSKVGRGLSMLEMVIAVTVFATVVVGLMGVWAMHARAVAHARNTLLATHLAESVMENALSQGWQVQAVAAGPSSTIDVHSTINGEQTSARFQYSVTVTGLPAGGGLGLKQINVQVTWTEEQRQREVNLETVVYWQG